MTINMQDQASNDVHVLAQATTAVTVVVGLLLKHLVASGNLDAKAMLSTIDMYRQDVEQGSMSESEKSVTRSVLKLIDGCLVDEKADGASA